MKKLLFAILLLPALLQAQDFSHRYFHYDQYFDAPTPFVIAATTADGADNKRICIQGGGNNACTDATRGAYLYLGGEQDTTLGGGVRISSGQAGTDNSISFYTHGSGRLKIADLADSDDVDLLLGNVSTTAPIFTIRGQTADTDDDGILKLASGGDALPSRGGYFQANGNDAGGAGAGGAIYIAAGGGTAGNIYFLTYTGPNTNAIRWTMDATTGNLTQDATNGGDLIMAQTDEGIIVGVGAINADVTAVLSAWSLYSQNIFPGSLRATNDALGGYYTFLKSRATDGSANTIVQSGDIISTIQFYGADGAAFQPAASIRGEVDGTPGGSDMPGRIVILTTPDGSAAPVEAFRITSQGTTLVKGVAVASLPASCAPGSLIRATNSNDCAAGGGDGAMCICTAAGAWALAHNY